MEKGRERKRTEEKGGEGALGKDNRDACVRAGRLGVVRDDRKCMGATDRCFKLAERVRTGGACVR